MADAAICNVGRSSTPPTSKNALHACALRRSHAMAPSAGGSGRCPPRATRRKIRFGNGASSATFDVETQLASGGKTRLASCNS